MVAVNWRLAAPESAYVINDSTAEVLFVVRFYRVIEGIRGDMKKVRR